MLSKPHGHSAAGRLGEFKKFNDLNRTRTRDLPACSMAPQPSTTCNIFSVTCYSLSLNHIIASESASVSASRQEPQEHYRMAGALLF
jgi:hypothetical protein